jgi:hypothetical protein
LHLPSAEEFASFFGSLEMVPPGVCGAAAWQPGQTGQFSRDEQPGVLAGAGRVA